MLADIDANATVYVQPSSRPRARRPHSVRIYRYPITCAGKKHTVADRRIPGPLRACFCRSACVFVRFICRCGKICEPKLYERRENGASEMSAAVMRKYAADFLSQVPQAHGFACELSDEVARRPCRGAKTQLAQQVEQLFEHSPPTAAEIRWPRRTVAVAAPSSLL
jgi:hypothetical protein